MRAVYRRSTVVGMSLGRPRRERAWRGWGSSAHFDRKAGIIPPPLEPGGAPPWRVSPAWRARRCPPRHNPQVLHALYTNRPFSLHHVEEGGSPEQGWDKLSQAMRCCGRPSTAHHRAQALTPTSSPCTLSLCDSSTRAQPSTMPPPPIEEMGMTKADLVDHVAA